MKKCCSTCLYFDRYKEYMNCKGFGTCECCDYKIPECIAEQMSLIDWEVHEEQGTDCDTWTPKEEDDG